MKKDFLLEIGCEEIPAGLQTTLEHALKSQFEKNFHDCKLDFDRIETFSTPRRLTVLVINLSATQEATRTERLGPSIQDAYDKDGTPTLICIGFAKACGVSIEKLSIKETPKGNRLMCIIEKPGNDTAEILADITNKVIAKLPMPKPMRWGNQKIQFIRPVHWVVMLFNESVIDTEILGVKTSNETRGHRFHFPKTMRLTKPQEYNATLYSHGFVIADRHARKKLIIKSIQNILEPGQEAVMPDALLEEVVGLVEWPIVLKGKFDETFLTVPKEVLITAMQTHQKCFPVIDQSGALLPYFILVSNIKSQDPAQVIAGNERVIRARLSDAAFFYAQDLKTPLRDHLSKLDGIVFHEKLGTLGEKTKRITTLALWIAKEIKSNQKNVKTAATLSKCDLVSDMVREFPNLQGVMGCYYALHDGSPQEVATAIAEQYLPKFSGDVLPETQAGLCLALADRVDTLVGVLGIEQFPTGDKDPFGLRRAANGIVRIIIEKNLDLDLEALILESKHSYQKTLANKNLIENTVEFIFARLKSWYTEKNIAIEIFDAVMARSPTSLLDFDKRLQAVLKFQQLPEAVSLASAHKRVNNILKKQTKKQNQKTNQQLFEFDAERTLYHQLQHQEKIVDALYKQSDYEKALSELSSLKIPIDQFFNDVMIMVDDEKKKQNRLALLASIHELFTKVADISRLPTPP